MPTMLESVSCMVELQLPRRPPSTPPLSLSVRTTPPAAIILGFGAVVEGWEGR